MDLFQYITDGLVTGLGSYSTIFFALTILLIFVGLAIRFSLPPIGLFTVLFFVVISFASFGSVTISLFSGLTYFMFLLLAIAVSFVWWVFIRGA